MSIIKLKTQQLHPFISIHIVAILSCVMCHVYDVAKIKKQHMDLVTSHKSRCSQMKKFKQNNKQWVLIFTNF